MPGSPEPPAEGVNKDTTAAAAANDSGHKQETQPPKVSLSAPSAPALEMDELPPNAAAPASPHDGPAPLKSSDGRNSKDSSNNNDNDKPDGDLSIRPADASAEASTSGLAVDIMLLLTTGARHPFRIDDKYLARRNVSTTGTTPDGKVDPFTITVYTLKELILRDWRKEWDQPPREPSAIRLIHFGRMLEDRMPLNRTTSSPHCTLLIR